MRDSTDPGAGVNYTTTVDADVVLDVRAVRKVYGRAADQTLVTALDGVDLQARQGSFVAIMGASGSGKSTLLHLIGGLTLPSSGSIIIEGHDLAAMDDARRTIFRRRRMGVIFQEFNLLPTLSARENIALPQLVDGKRGADSAARVAALLDLVHLTPRGGHRPDALSGGEQQRVAIARALLNEPAIILADEPTGSLDSKQSLEVWALLRRVTREQRTTVVMVTHEAHGAAFADEVVVLKDGRLVGSFRNDASEDAGAVVREYQALAG